MIGRLRHTIRQGAERLFGPRGRAAILLYHRIADEPLDPYGLCVTASQFEEHLQAIRQIGCPVPLGDLARAVDAGSVPDQAVAVTFDDGYLDNYEIARPLLEKYDVPATIFVTTGPGGRKREFWSDELERIFLQPGTLPETLEVHIDGSFQRWELGACATGPLGELETYPNWRLFSDEPPTARHATFRDLYYLINPLPEPRRTVVMDTLGAWAGLDTGNVRSSRRTMTPEQLTSMDSEGLIRIEAHTVNHVSLRSQSDETQRAEVTTSKLTLEGWLGRPVVGFAYPYGAYNPRTIPIVRESGFDYACSCTHRSAWARSERFLLPRLEVTACDGDVLTDMLRAQLR